MKERPTLFSYAMVRAILAGQKTVTRRVVKPPHDFLLAGGAKLEHLARVPFAVGDRLWVRETWGLRRHHDVTDWNRASVKGVRFRDEWVLDYRADWGPSQEACFWRPSIHMPRWASRLTLAVTDVRAERLQNITEEQAKAEGITGPFDVGYQAYRIPDDSKPRFSSARAAFECLWDSINGKRGGRAWAYNPWVWAVSFQVVR